MAELGEQHGSGGPTHSHQIRVSLGNLAQSSNHTLRGLTLRHAHCSDGDAERRLTPAGRRASLELGRLLAEWDAVIYTSFHPYLRHCLATAKAIVEGVRQEGGSAEILGCEELDRLPRDKARAQSLQTDVVKRFFDHHGTKLGRSCADPKVHIHVVGFSWLKYPIWDRFGKPPPRSMFLDGVAFVETNGGDAILYGPSRASLPQT